jgi:small conductance mechanosensitive channel
MIQPSWTVVSSLAQQLSRPELLLSALSRLGMILLIVLLASAGYGIAAKVIRTTLIPRPGAANYERKIQRSKTMVPLLRSVSRYLIYFVAGVAVLQQLGIDATAIVASAGVVGLAVGFGAQTLVKDLISGFFLLFEGLIAVGDVITVGEHTGEVEAIGIRVTQVRKLSGELRIIPNGEITSFGHLKRDFSRAVVNVGLAYEQDHEAGLGVLASAARAWAAQHGDLALDAPDVQGIVDFGASECTARVIVKVKAGEQWGAERSLRGAIKRAFDDAGVEMPFPRQVFYQRGEGRGRIPPRRLEPRETEPVAPEEAPEVQGRQEGTWDRLEELAGRFRKILGRSKEP